MAKHFRGKAFIFPITYTLFRGRFFLSQLQINNYYFMFNNNNNKSKSSQVIAVLIYCGCIYIYHLLYIIIFSLSVPQLPSYFLYHLVIYTALCTVINCSCHIYEINIAPRQVITEVNQG